MIKQDDLLSCEIYNNLGGIKTVNMRFAICLLFPVCGLLTACQKETIIPDLEGSLVGYVYTFDEFANRLEDRSSVLVSAIGLKTYSTRTDKNGRFELAGLPTGTYELSLSKPGFATLKQYGIKHLGGTPTILGLNFSTGSGCSAFFIYEVPTTEIIDLSVEKDSLFATFGFKAGSPDRMTLQVYLSGMPGFSLADAKQSLSCFLQPSQDKFKGAFNYSNLRFEPGEKVYYKACVLNRKNVVYEFGSTTVSGIDSYFDYTTYTTVYPNLGNESAQFSFVIPE